MYCKNKTVEEGGKCGIGKETGVGWKTHECINTFERMPVDENNHTAGYFDHKIDVQCLTNFFVNDPKDGNGKRYKPIVLEKVVFMIKIVQLLVLIKKLGNL